MLLILDASLIWHLTASECALLLEQKPHAAIIASVSSLIQAIIMQDRRGLLLPGHRARAGSAFYPAQMLPVVLAATGHMLISPKSVDNFNLTVLVQDWCSLLLPGHRARARLLCQSAQMLPVLLLEVQQGCGEPFTGP